MVGKAAPGQPVLPVMGGPHQPAVCLLIGVGRLVLRPRQRAEAVLPLLHEGAGARPRPLEADAHVGREPQLQIHGVGSGDALVVAPVAVGPSGRPAAVVHHRLALHDDLDLSVDAAHGPQEHVVGVVVGGRPPVGAGQLVRVVPGPDQQHVPHDDPPRRGPPARLHCHRPRQVTAGGRHRDVVGAQPEAPGVPVEDGAEHAGRVQPGQAQPLHVAAGSHQSGGLAIGQKGVVGYGRKGRVPEQHVGRVRGRHVTTFPASAPPRTTPRSLTRCRCRGASWRRGPAVAAPRSAPP